MGAKGLLSGNLLDAVLVTGAGAAAGGTSGGKSGRKTFQAVVSGSGTVTATVLVQVSNDGTNWLTLGTITLSGTTTATDGFASEGSWMNYRGNVTALTGTGAAVTLIVAQE